MQIRKRAEVEAKGEREDVSEVVECLCERGVFLNRFQGSSFIVQQAWGRRLRRDSGTSQTPVSPLLAPSSFSSVRLLPEPGPISRMREHKRRKVKVIAWAGRVCSRQRERTAVMDERKGPLGRRRGCI